MKHFKISCRSGKGKRSVALSALTLLAFLFFINILQNCIDDHMNQLQPPEVIVITTPAPAAAALFSRYREAEENNYSNMTLKEIKTKNDYRKRGKMTNGHTSASKKTG